MHIPTLHGTLDQADFFVYAACDHAYFTEFAPAFVNSVRANTDLGLHIHIFNPKPEQLAWCQRQAVGVTWEHVPRTLFVPATQRWIPPPDQEPEATRYARTVNAMGKGGDASVTDRMQKTYYACARFMRLAQLCQGRRLLAVDIDAVVRSQPPDLGSDHDFYIHHISGRRARYLAGGLWLNGTSASDEFLSEYSASLKSWFERDQIYWGLDQDLLDPIVPRYNHGQLPMTYIDWNMQESSHVWTAKGTRKNLEVFVNEQRKYSA